MKQKLESVVFLIGMSVIQVFVTLMLVIFCSIMVLFVRYFASGVITFVLYALIWWLVWWLQFGAKGIQRFYTKLVFAEIPLIVLSIYYVWVHPVPEDTTMIPLLATDIHFSFATAITGTLLFPLYSIMLNRYFLLHGHPRFRFLGTASGLVVFGAIVFTSCYSLLPPQW